VHRTRVIHTELARLVSDHLPLVVEVALAREPVADMG
jgi:endonuclease/exonuclease/phosphatase family metal-dependent hydrolase